MPPSYTFKDLFRGHDWSRSSLGPIASWPALLTSHARFVLDASQPMMMTWGASNTLIFNEGYAGFLGPKFAESLGQPLQEIWAAEWENIAPYFCPARNGTATKAEDVPFRTWESGFNEVRFFTFAYSPIREADERVVGVNCMTTDTTERVRAVERLKAERDTLTACFESAPGIVAVLEGPSHQFVFANAACRTFLGERDLMGRSVAEAVPEVDPQGFIAILDRVYRTGKPFTGKALPVRLPDRHGEFEKKYIDALYAPWRNGAGEIVGVIHEGHDVTDHIATAERARSLQDDLIHLSRVTAMGTMASTMAHELNQPLTAIANMASAARRLVEQGKIEFGLEALSAIADSSLRAGQIIKNVRAMSLKREGQSTSINLRKMVANTIRLFAATERRRVVREIEADLVVVADEIQIQQVLLNLLRNALEAVAGRPDGKVIIRGEARNGDALITVQDNGPGIAGDRLDDVFQSFMTTKTEGMGIGLAISRTIVQAHDGRLWAENAPDGGAMFSLTLKRSFQSETA